MSRWEAKPREWRGTSCQGPEMPLDVSAHARMRWPGRQVLEHHGNPSGEWGLACAEKVLGEEGSPHQSPGSQYHQCLLLTGGSFLDLNSRVWVLLLWSGRTPVGLVHRTGWQRLRAWLSWKMPAACEHQQS